MRDSIIFYRSFYEAINELPQSMQAKVYSAIFEYSLNFNEIKLSGLPKTIFTLIKPQLDANNKRFENGKKGGRKKSEESRTETKTEPNQNQNETKTETNNNVNNNANVNVNENANENENEFFNEAEASIDSQVENQPSGLSSNNTPAEDLGKEKSCAKKESQEEIIYHFDSDNFKKHWISFKDFRKKKHKFTFLNNESENRKLTELFNLSNQNEDLAIRILQNSIDNGYKGLFLPKNENDGNSNSNSYNANNRFSNNNGNTYGGAKVSGKTSFNDILARRLASAGNSESGNITIDAEICN